MNLYIWLLCIAIFAVVAIASVLAGNMTLHAIAKTLTTVIILALALFSFASYKTPPLYTTLIAIGLFFALIGDALLVNKTNDTFFLAGLSAFLLGHVMYVIAFFRAGTFHQNDIVTGIILLGVGIGMYVLLHKGLGTMRVPVILYITTILLMVFRAISFLSNGTFSTTRSILLAVGATLFFISDSLLGFDRFHTHIPMKDLYILSTYYIGQTLIALSTYPFH